MAGIFEREEGRPQHKYPELIGRERESATLAGLLGRSRMVTVVGLGGAGKSALAAAAAERVCRTGTTVTAVDMAELGGTGQAFQAVTHSVAGHESLLVVDNCDHVLAPAAAALGHLLADRPGLRVLATSRRRLGVEGETVLPLEPLRLSGAVRLLELRARQLGAPMGKGERADEADEDGEKAGNAETAENAETSETDETDETDEDRVTAGRVCLRLDCLPLALGLAAGLLPELTPRELLVQLSETGGSLGLAAVGSDVPSRHRTLRHCHGWSHEQCMPQERLLWARLSAFGGTFTRTAAEKVCEDEQLSRPTIASAVDGLVGQGLLEHVNGRPELLRMPRTVQDYGSEWLARLGEETRLLERVLMWSRGLL